MKYYSVKTIAVLLLFLQASHFCICDPVDELYQRMKKIESADSIVMFESHFNDKTTDLELGKFYFLIAWKYRQVENYGKAFDYYNKSLKIYRGLDDLYREKKCLESLGGIAVRLNNYKKAHSYYKEAWEINKKLGDKKEIALSLRDIGITLSKTLEDKKEGLWYLTQSADLLEQIKENYLLSRVHIQMGVIHNGLNQYGSAMDCYDFALKYSPGSEEILARVLNNQSYSLMEQGHYRRALTLQDSAIIIKRDLGDDWLLMTSLNTLGVILYKLGHFDESYNALVEAFNINTSKNGLKQEGHKNLKESYHYLDSVCIAVGDRYRLIDNGITEEFLSRQEQIIDQQEAYRIRDMIYQGDQIEEKDELVTSLESSNENLWILLALLFLFFCIIVLITRQKIILIRRINKMVRDMDHKREVVLETLRRQGITLF